MPLSWAAIFGSAAAVFAFSKLSPGGLQLQLLPSVPAGDIFPRDARCPPSHLSLVSGLKGNPQVLEKPECWLNHWCLSAKAISQY